MSPLAETQLDTQVSCVVNSEVEREPQEVIGDVRDLESMDTDVCQYTEASDVLKYEYKEEGGAAQNYIYC